MPHASPHASPDVSLVRFVTPHRCGKWYPDLATAQAYAATIGAGFRDGRTGEFVAYRGTRIEIRRH